MATPLDEINALLNKLRKEPFNHDKNEEKKEISTHSLLNQTLLNEAQQLKSQPVLHRWADYQMFIEKALHRLQGHPTNTDKQIFLHAVEAALYYLRWKEQDLLIHHSDPSANQSPAHSRKAHAIDTYTQYMPSFFRSLFFQSMIREHQDEGEQKQKQRLKILNKTWESTKKNL